MGDTIVRFAPLWVALAFVAATALAGWLLGSALVPFAVSMALAYALDPVRGRLEAVGFRRSLAAAVPTSAAVVLIVGIAVFAAPQVWDQLADVAAEAERATKGREGVIAAIAERAAGHLPQGIADAAERAAASAVEAASGMTLPALKGIALGSAAVFETVVYIFLVPILTFFLLRDWPVIVGAVDARVPQRVRAEVREIAHELDGVVSAWMRGVLVLMLSLSAYYVAVLSLVGLPYAFLIGVVAGCVAFVPFLGPAIGFVPAMVAALAAFDSPLMWGVTAVVFFLGQVLESYFLTPWLVGRRVRLPEAWTIFAVVACGKLFGVVGVLVAVPAAGSVAVLLRRLDCRYMRGTLVRDVPGK